MTDNRQRPWMVWWPDFWHHPEVEKLDGAQAGIYMLMLGLAWSRAPHVGRPSLPANPRWIARELRLNRRSDVKTVQELCTNPALWAQDGDEFINARQQKNWQELIGEDVAKARRARDAARTRWEKGHAGSIADAQPEQSNSNAFPSPSPSPSPSPDPVLDPSPLDPATPVDPTSPEGSTHSSKTPESATPDAAPDGASGPPGRARAEPTGADVMALWNPLAAQAGLPQIRAWTPDRERHLRARCRDRPDRQQAAWWAAVFGRMANSAFLTGHGPRGWRADLDWLIRSETHLVRVLEGAYDDRPVPGRDEPAGWAGLREYVQAHAEEVLSAGRGWDDPG